MAFKRAFSYKITSGILGSPPVDVEADEVRKVVAFRQHGCEDGTQYVNVRFDELFDLLHVLEEIRKEFVVRPHGGRD
jgi:hypothetical protein